MDGEQLTARQQELRKELDGVNEMLEEIRAQVGPDAINPDTNKSIYEEHDEYQRLLGVRREIRDELSSVDEKLSAVQNSVIPTHTLRTQGGVSSKGEGE